MVNVGTLVTPLTQAQYKNQQAAIPSNLFSHLDQQTEWQTSLAQGFGATGWGGRVADAIQGCNTSGFPTIVSVGGNNLFNTGAQTNPATVTAGQVLGLQGFNTSAASVARLVRAAKPADLRQRSFAGSGIECHRFFRSESGYGSEPGAGRREGAHHGVPQHFARNAACAGRQDYQCAGRSSACAARYFSPTSAVSIRTIWN